MRLFAIPAVLALFTACPQAPAECGPAECASVCGDAHADPTAAPAPSTSAKADAGLTEMEQAIVGPILEDIRGGIRPWDDQSVGICKGKKDCDEFLGLEPAELPPGDYMLQAVLRVPKVGEKGTWQVTLDTECTTTRDSENGSSTSTNNYSKTYDVNYINEERGYRLAPLRTIESPSTSGRKECVYKLTYSHPSGPQVTEGKWIVPQG